MAGRAEENINHLFKRFDKLLSIDRLQEEMGCVGVGVFTLAARVTGPPSRESLVTIVQQQQHICGRRHTEHHRKPLVPNLY